ncbi:TIGR02646 family protein [Photobacterium sp. CCB-ST2H9]|uniref:TIGR02646 family protein n=1 Tax=Photobacterium sp. CCB-ST2H9 TaxID=2912855 RepID=UPI00200656C9|nr:TIGR02646 family protein [Photobacterium sp. CCB-ST2H9]UTM57396.1 TIGR02646 family protein [Photobacterium sp. CCB-ST2H9]
MRKITKRAGYEPQELTDWKRSNPNQRYPQLKDGAVRQAIRTEALAEQYYLCGHCCQTLSGDGDCHNEHVEAQDLNQNRTLDFSNIIASCNTLKQCGDSHKSQPLPLTPLMAQCETDLVFKLSGRVSGKTPDAIETIRVLNLGDTEKNNKSLIEKRKQLSFALLTEHAIAPEDEEDWAEEPELLADVINDLLTPDNGKLKPFAPVVANVLRQWIA